MTVTLEIPNEYGYVFAVALSTALVNTWHGVQTVKARKASGINYPNTYATAEQAEKNPAAYQLNCAQRAHANYTENLLPFVTSLLIAGLRFPVPAASLGLFWLVARVTYTVGYVSSRGPKGRVAGSLGHYLTQGPLLILAAYTSFKFVSGS